MNDRSSPDIVTYINDVELRELLSAKDVGKGRSVLRRILALRASQPATPTGGEAVAWRVKNDFGYWYITQDKALADTLRDVEKNDVEPLYALPTAMAQSAEGEMTNSDDLPITRREMREFLDQARKEAWGVYGQPAIEDLYRLFNETFPKNPSKGA